jgi:hypothetical protein
MTSWLFSAIVPESPEADREDEFDCVIRLFEGSL